MLLLAHTYICISAHITVCIFAYKHIFLQLRVFRTIVFIFIVISTTFRPICPPAFFRCLSNSGTFTELRTASFIETTGNPRGFNKGRSSKFCEGSRVRQTPEEARRTYRPKRCGNNNKDEDNSPKNLNDKNQQASSQKFRQHISAICWGWGEGVRKRKSVCEV